MAKTLFTLNPAYYDEPEDFPADEDCGIVTIRFFFDPSQSDVASIREAITDWCDWKLSDEYGLIKAEQIDA